MCFYYQLCVDYVSDESNDNHIKLSKPVKPANQIIQSAYNKIITTPNPANVYVIFNWSLPLLTSDAYLLITNISGKTIEQKTISTKQGQWIWDVRTIKNGMYLYEVKSDNQSLGNGKIVINN